MKPEVKVFTREQPCTKLEIWNAFRGLDGFVQVPVALAQAQIGANVPRIMEREGRLVVKEIKGTEYYCLTSEGRDWLYEGFRRYLKNHPTHAGRANHIPADWGYVAKPARLRRTR